MPPKAKVAKHDCGNCLGNGRARRVPAEADGDRNEDGDLKRFDGEDREDLGGKHLGAPERSRAETFQYPVPAFEPRLNAEVDHRGAHNRECEHSGCEKSTGWGVPVGSRCTAEKKTRSSTGMPIVSSSDSPRRSVIDSSAPVCARTRLNTSPAPSRSRPATRPASRLATRAASRPASRPTTCRRLRGRHRRSGDCAP